MSFDTERFIVEIQNRPCLWDSSLSEYSDRNMKIKCWDEVVDIFKEPDNITVQEKQHFAESLQKRWKSIRGCYTREVNRQKSVKSGSGCGSRKSEYIYYKQLQFLQKVVAIRAPDPTTATADPPTSEDNPEHVTQEIRQVHGRKKQKTKENTENDKFIAVLNKSIESREKCEVGNQDEDKLFLLSLVGTLKKIPPNRKMATKIKIMTILNEESCNVQTQNNRDYWSSPPPDLPSRSYNREYSTSRRGFLSTMGYNADTSNLSHEQATSYSHGYSTRAEQPEISPMDYADSPNALTAISDDSSILDIYGLNTVDVERFIECVKKYPILYDTRHEFYDDFEKKSKTWRHVGRELDEFAEVLRSKWEDLKDGYSRYKRSQVATANKQWRTWCWGDNMKFLDDCEQDNAAPGQGTANSAITCDTRPGGSTMSDTDEDFEAKRLKLDSVDHLFASYAETFRRFSLRNQCAIKIKMAKMFADTEQAEFDEPRAGGSTEGEKETVVVKLEDRTLLEIVEVPIIIKQERIDDDSVRP